METAVTGGHLPQQEQAAPTYSRISIVLEFRPSFSSSNDFSKEAPKSGFLCEIPQLLTWLIFLSTWRYFFFLNLQSDYGPQTIKLQPIYINILVSSKRNLFSTFVICSWGR